MGWESRPSIVVFSSKSSFEISGDDNGREGQGMKVSVTSQKGVAGNGGEAIKRERIRVIF